MEEFDEVKRKALAGDKMGAIKLYREQTNVGLAEAKSAVEQMLAQLRGFASAEISFPKAAPGPLHQTAAISEALFAGNKIQAIKLYREQSKAGLAEAKHAVEEIEKQLRLSAPGLFSKPASKGCLVLVVAFVLAGATFWKWLA